MTDNETFSASSDAFGLGTEANDPDAIGSSDSSLSAGSMAAAAAPEAAGLLHLVAFRWRAGTSPAAPAALRSALLAMAADLPQILSYRCGPDLGVLDGSWDFAVVAAARTVEDLRSYLDHPSHVAIVENLVRPILEQRVAVQLPLAATDSLLQP